MPGLGYLSTFMDALVALEGTVDPKLRVTRWQPNKVDPPHLYNWLLPSPADVPAVGIVHDRLMIAVRIIVKPSDLVEEEAALEGYFDKARDVIDADLIQPAHSTLSGAAHEVRRTTTRAIAPVFNEIPYLGLELVLQADLRRRFA